MLLARLWILFLLLVLFFFLDHPIFTMADHNILTGDYPKDRSSTKEFLCHDVYNHASQANLSFAQRRRRLDIIFGCETRVIILITILNIIVYTLRQIQEAKYEGERDDNTKRLSLAELRCRRFSIAEIEQATNNFDDKYVIGRGGSGKVYKGIIDDGASTVAIKRLSSVSTQGGSEFWTEIEMLSKFRHIHLVSLIGYCDECHEMILVCEYVPCGTLADHLFRKGGMSPLSWVERLRICIGSARGLEYLHTGMSIKQRVIHRDVKSTNILLDENLEAKIADFGISKLLPPNKACTFVSTNVKGTFGYMDPEYFLTSRLTKKSDLYSFGVVLFEVLCGRRAVDLSLDDEQCSLASWAKQCIKEGKVDQIIDPSLNMKILPNSLVAFTKIAYQCLHSEPKCRPTMAEIVVVLEFALALQESADSFGFEEAANISDHRNKHSSMEVKLISDGYGGDQSKQIRMKRTSIALSRKVLQFLSAPIRVISVHSDAKHSSYTRGNYNRVDNKVRLMTIGIVPEARGCTMTSNLKMFTLAELRHATRGFSPDMLLGEGCGGRVFLGWIDKETFTPSRFGVGMAIAVVICNPNRCQGHKCLQTGVDLYGRFHDPDLVKLLGFCLDDQELILAFEYMQKGCLDNYIYKDSTETISWVVLLKILIGVARCLASFHTTENQITYGFTTSSILLDGDFNARIAGFGLAKFGPADKHEIVKPKQHGLGDSGDISPEFCCSGYLSPEYVEAGLCSVKNDVFAFGVVLLEILTGMRVTDINRSNKKCKLINLVKPVLASKRKVKRILNPQLLAEDDYFPEVANASLSVLPALTLKCLDPKPEKRPSMRQISETLEETRVGYLSQVCEGKVRR